MTVGVEAMAGAAEAAEEETEAAVLNLTVRPSLPPALFGLLLLLLLPLPPLRPEL